MAVGMARSIRLCSPSGDKQVIILDWLKSHKALIGAVVVAVGGYLTGTLDLTATIAAVLAALSGGLKPAPQPVAVFDPYRHDAA